MGEKLHNPEVQWKKKFSFNDCGKFFKYKDSYTFQSNFKVAETLKVPHFSKEKE